MLFNKLKQQLLIDAQFSFGVRSPVAEQGCNVFLNRHVHDLQTKPPLMTITNHRPLSNPAAIILMACLLFRTGNLCAQEKFSASITGGLSFPAGRFADKVNPMPTGLVNVDGAANTGWNGNLQLGVAITPQIRANVIVGLSVFRQDATSFEETLRWIHGNTPVAEPESWRVLKVLAGPSFILPLCNKLSLRPSLAAGIAKTSVPELTYTLYNPGGNPITTITRDKISMPAAFAYQGGLGWGYKLGKQTTLLADFNFFSARAKYDYQTLTTTGSPVTLKHEYSLSSYSTSLGVEFFF